MEADNPERGSVSLGGPICELDAGFHDKVNRKATMELCRTGRMPGAGLK
jgi:hypothetical protein